ncbi:tyrosine-type recombinase/integrase [Urbifossiella limnaea]|uniref:Tyrosine recombinase XerC n=1 Tax=Urbifossiella limnaea TaxID=2528023 RepID=A0A517XV45_9BACT|nr:tyrosine-type recombinase/integrase [Urbifossiella limnaea]QDU21382.1 Tyrosine recombinase XerC [Urbifossiella limnaea]
MARTRHPWYRRVRNAWFVEVDGKQVRLGEHPADAPGPRKSKNTGLWNAPPSILKLFGELMGQRESEPSASAPRDSVVFLFGRYLGWTKKNKAEATYQQRRFFLRSFIRFRSVRSNPPNRITVDLVEHWLDAHPTWTASRRHAILCVLGAFNWAVNPKRRLLSVNPIAGIDVPPATRVRAYLTPEQRRVLFDATRDEAFRGFLTALSETGCRPGEVAAVTAADANLDLGVWTLEAHKTGRKTGKPRVVYLTDAMVGLTRRLAAQNQDGPLFLNSRGRPWNRNAIRCRFRVLRKRFPAFGHFTAYSYRRAFVTDALEKGVDVVKVAELVGHSSTDMVMRHYSQLQERVAHMREMAKKAAG